MKKLLILALILGFCEYSFADSQTDSQNYRRTRFHYNELNNDSDEEISEDEDSTERKRTSIRRDHSKLRETLDSLSLEQKEAIKKEKKRHRERMKEIMDGKI